MSPKSSRMVYVVGPHLAPNEEAQFFYRVSVIPDDIEAHILGLAEVPPNLPERYRAIVCCQRHLYGLRRLLCLTRHLWKYARQHRPDCMTHISAPNLNGVAIILVSRFLRIRSVLHVTGEVFQEYRRYRGLPRLRFWVMHTLLTRWALRCSDIVFTIGKSLRRDLVAHGIRPERIHILPVLIDKRRFEPRGNERDEARKRLAIENTKKVILFVGRLSHAKGCDWLEAIIGEVLKRSSDFVFLLVGEGPEHSRFLGFDKKQVCLLGNIPWEEMPRLYPAADLLILPSRNEGVPNVLLEAMAADVPVVATPVGDIPSLGVPAARTWQDFVEYILREEWPVTPLPPEYEYEALTREYRNFFRTVALPDSGRE
jgi:glycosyltransferase involved in cell wall biosynthesis